MSIYEKHVFVCVNQRPPGHPRGCCAARKSAEVLETLKNGAAMAGLLGKVRVNKAGCLDQCEAGPVVVVYPEAVWYGPVAAEDAEEILQQHLIGGRPVERLFMKPPGSDGSIP